MDVSDDEWYASKSVKHDQADQSVLSHTDKDIWHQIFMDFRQALVYTYSSMGNMGWAWQTANTPCGLLELSTDWVSSSTVPWKSPFSLILWKTREGEQKEKIWGKQRHRIAYKIFFIDQVNLFAYCLTVLEDLCEVILPISKAIILAYWILAEVNCAFHLISRILW